MKFLTKSTTAFCLMAILMGDYLPAQAPNSAPNSDVVDATSLNNKIMAGYQGWFRTPGDQENNNGWAHWFNAPTPSPEKLAFDSWPDLSEYPSSEKCEVPGFTYPDGSPAYLYSAQNPATVLRHFQWMQKAGIDGVWLSEFCSHMPGGHSEADYPTVETIMKNVQAAATATGRTWAFMYDFSGLSPTNVQSIITNQWKKMVDSGITSDPRYLHHDGKPVLLLWGFFPKRPQADPSCCVPLITFLQAPGPYQAAVVGGGDPNWRTAGSAAFQDMLMSLTAWQPWQVGRVATDPATGYKIANTTHWADDIQMCQSHHVLFIPVVYAGTHIAGPPPTPPALATVPRRNGDFLWEQFVTASQLHAINSVFVAMFDEVNEGTEIMKVTNNPPMQAPFLTFEGSTSDWYLRLAAMGENMLRNNTPITKTIPISPFDSTHSYHLINRSSGLALASSKGGPALQQASDTTDAPTDGDPHWLIGYDGAGNYQLTNASSKKGLAIHNAAVTMEDPSVGDEARWTLVWDGTGCCKLQSKATNKMLATGDHNSLVETDDATSDASRWTIKPD